MSLVYRFILARMTITWHPAQPDKFTAAHP